MGLKALSSTGKLFTLDIFYDISSGFAADKFPFE